MPASKIGIAGYMGSGKSLACRFLADHGYEVIDADSEAKRLMNETAHIRERLAQEFGSDVVTDGTVNFKILGSLVFGSSSQLGTLNSIVHPALVEHLGTLLERSGPHKKFVLDAALIPQWGIGSWFDTLLWVHAHREIRMERLRKKLVVPEEKLKQRIALQEEALREPPEPPWRKISNETSPEAFYENLRVAIEKV